MEKTRSPKYPWNPFDHSPMFFDPGRIRQAEWTMSELPDTAPACVHDIGSAAFLSIPLARVRRQPAAGFRGHGRGPSGICLNSRLDSLNRA